MGPEPGDRAAAGPSTRSSTAPSPTSDQAPPASTSIGAEPPAESDPASPPVRNEARPTVVEPRRKPGRAAPVRRRRRSLAGTLMGTTAVACVAALGLAFTRGELEPRPQQAVAGEDGRGAMQAGRHDADLPAETHPVDDGQVALGSVARSDAFDGPQGPEEPEAAAPAPSSTPDHAREAEIRIPVVIVIGGIEGGEVEVGDERLPLDPIAHTALSPGRYPLRWRNASSTEWRDAGAVDVLPEDVHDGLLRIQVSPTEGARVERRP